MSGKIGIGVITCNREKLFSILTQSLPAVDYAIAVNDGKPYDSFLYEDYYRHVVQHKQNCGVGISKNDALKYLAGVGCEHIFVLEDDIKIINKDAFSHYIECSKRSGVLHLNYAYHGNANRSEGNIENPRKLIYEGGEPILSLNKNIIGAFSYYHISALQKIGYMDERYLNGWEHVDHTLAAIHLGIHPPFWWFADAANSTAYIEDQDQSLEHSVIRGQKIRWRLRMYRNTRHFKQKWGCAPWDIPDVDYGEVEKSLISIKNCYSQSDLAE